MRFLWGECKYLERVWCSLDYIIQDYYDEKTNTYVFKEDNKYIRLVVFNFDLNVDACIDASNIKALNIGKLSCSLGAGRINKEDTIDYGVGIVLNKQVGDLVNIGDTLFTLYKKNSNNITLNISEYYEIN